MEVNGEQTTGGQAAAESNGRAATETNLGGAASNGAASNDTAPNDTAPNDTAPNEREEEYEFSVDERNAMRAFLARGEVRLSTIHRIAVAFMSGAGLLFLFPVFLKDGVLTLLTSLLNFTPVLPNGTETLGKVGTVALYLCMLYPFVLSLALPAGALLLLLEDTVRFYFVGHPPTFPEEFFNPRFALTGVAFSPDESPEVKSRVLRHEYGTDLITFVISRADAHSRYYSNIIDKPERLIVPPTRKLPRLLRAGVLKLKEEKPLEAVADDDLVRVQGSYHNGGGYGSERPYAERSVEEIDRFNAALGLTGFIERPLYEEVAKTEVSLVRHALKLRRLVLRYFQALLILIWTSLVTFMMLPILQDPAQRFSVPIVFAATYLLWALLAPRIVQLPLFWVASHPHDEVLRDSIKRFQQLDGLQAFGKLTQRLCYVAVAASVVALVLEFMLRV